jgi:hypothetical protein
LTRRWRLTNKCVRILTYVCKDLTVSSVSFLLTIVLLAEHVFRVSGAGFAVCVLGRINYLFPDLLLSYVPLCGLVGFNYARLRLVTFGYIVSAFMEAVFEV